jgi:hypothetical protein
MNVSQRTGAEHLSEENAAAAGGLGCVLIGCVIRAMHGITNGYGGCIRRWV